MVYAFIQYVWYWGRLGAGGRGGGSCSGQREFPPMGGNLLPGTIICLLFFPPLPPIFSLRPSTFTCQSKSFFPSQSERKPRVVCSGEGVERGKTVPAVRAETDRASERFWKCFDDATSSLHNALGCFRSWPIGVWEVSTRNPPLTIPVATSQANNLPHAMTSSQRWARQKSQTMRALCS